MNVKFVTSLVIFGSIVQSAIAVYSPNSCTIQNGVEIDLAVFKFGEEISIAGLKGTNDRIFSLLEYVLTQFTYGIHTKAEYNSRIQNLKNQTHVAIMVGIPPTMDMIKVIIPETVVDVMVNDAQVLLFGLVDNIFAAVNLSQLKDYNEAKRQIAILEKESVPFVLGAGQMLGAIIGNFIFPKAIEVLNECIDKTVVSNFSTAFNIIYTAIRKLLAQIFKDNKGGYNDCLEVIRALKKKSFAHLKAETIGKYTLLRNFYLNTFFERYGILPGLISLQAAASASSDGQLLGTAQSSLGCV